MKRKIFGIMLILVLALSISQVTLTTFALGYSQNTREYKSFQNLRGKGNQSRIVFTSNRDGNYEIYVMNGDGSNQIRLTSDPANDSQPA